MNEKDIVNAIKKALTREGAWVTKTHGSLYSSGLPDLIACYKGRFVGIEVKRPETRHTVTERQQAVLDRISAAGGLAGVATSVEEALAILKSPVAT
jgi:Holliday junction resolvase